MTAKTVVDVILGEAKAGSYQDMLAIASVISNRATGGQTSWQDVVARTPEFNAYGNPLPRGVNKYRSMAQKAIDQVKSTGPVHNATFYATPNKLKNLPKGLSRITETDGHVFLTDPQKRPIYTGGGLKRIDYAKINDSISTTVRDDSLMNLEYNSAGLPDTDAPIPAGLFGTSPKSNGLGLANLVDGNRNKSAVQYANQQATRNQRLSPGVQARIDQAVAAAGKKHGVEITPIVGSGGQFSKIDLAAGFKGGRKGSTRHDHGMSSDTRFKVNGKLLSMANPKDREIMGSIIEEGVALGLTGVGGSPKYMGLNTIHLGMGNAATWGAYNEITGRYEPASKFVRDAYARGRERYDPNKPLYVDVPTPQSNKPAYTPKASDYSNYQMNVPRPKPVDFSKDLYAPEKYKPEPYMQQSSVLPKMLTPQKPASMAAPPPTEINPKVRLLQEAYQKRDIPPPPPRPSDIPKPTYTPKASDYSNYMMNVKQPTLPTGSAIPLPAASPAIQGPVGQPIPQVAQQAAPQKVKQKITDHLKKELHPKTLAARGAGSLIGGLLGGPLGAKAGQMFGPQIAQALNNRKQPGLFGMFNNNNVPIPTNRNMSSSSSTWGNAQNQGATYIASDGATITGRGNGTYSRTNPITGKSSQWNEDGSRSTKGY